MTATGRAASGGSSQLLDPQNLPPDSPESALPSPRGRVEFRIQPARALVRLWGEDLLSGCYDLPGISGRS
jgi:hypothetical protein